MNVCRVCSNAAGNRVFRAREMMFGLRESFEYFQCAACGCLQISEIPSAEAMSRHYPSNYYSYGPSATRTGLRRRLANLRDRYAIEGRGLLGRFLYSRFPNPAMKCLDRVPMPRDAKILDVGCGSGEFLHELRELGYEKLAGVDPFLERDTTYADGVTVFKKGIHEVEPGWDVIMFHHSFEHVPDPAETLNATRAALAVGGHCMISIPVADCEAWEHYGVNWVQLDAPRHFHLHTERSMGMLAQGAGLEIVDIVRNSTPFQFWGSEQYQRDIPLRDKRSFSVSPNASIFSRAEIAQFERRAKRLNETRRGDQAVFYLVRREA